MTTEVRTKKRFVITADASYARTAMALWERGVVAELSCGLDPIDEDGNDLGGTHGEWRVVWKQVVQGQLPFVQVLVFDDGWKQLIESGFHEVMAELGGSKPAVAEFVAVLMKHGWVDSTVRGQQ